MAAGEQECSLCLDIFKDPRLIPCHHSFCYRCLETYVTANISNDRFDCPICRYKIELPASGVSGFAINWYIDTNDTFPCDICGPNIVAISRCMECEENLCKPCCNAHEKSKASRTHKIIDLRSLDATTKRKIRQRVFCDQHPVDEIRFFCEDCKVLTCLVCKVDKHLNHTTDNTDVVADKLRNTLENKRNECSDKLERIINSKKTGEDVDRKINDAEQEELKAVDDQHSWLIGILNEQVALAKARIKSVYHDHRQQNAVLTSDIQDDFKMCWNTNDQTQTLINQGTDIDIIKKGPDLLQLISSVISKPDHTPNTYLEKKLFSPGEIKPNELIAMFGIMHQSTKLSPEERLQKEKEENERKEREKREKKEKDEMERKIREKQQIHEYRAKYGFNMFSASDAELKELMCSRCQGWCTRCTFRSGYACSCDAQT